MKRICSLLLLLVSGMVLIAGAGCNKSNMAGPKELLEKYFSSAVRQDYATTYSCYYELYHAKVSKDEYLNHRKDASVLQSYKINSIRQDGDTARADVLLTFAPSEKLKRTAPVSATVTEEMVKEGGDWKIKVW